MGGILLVVGDLGEMPKGSVVVDVFHGLAFLGIFLGVGSEKIPLFSLRSLGGQSYAGRCKVFSVLSKGSFGIEPSLSIRSFGGPNYAGGSELFFSVESSDFVNAHAEIVDALAGANFLTVLLDSSGVEDA